MATEDSSKVRILTVNGGSSSIKFALFETNASFERTLAGEIQGIGSSEAVFRTEGPDQANVATRPVAAHDYGAAVALLADWVADRLGPQGLTAVGHRLVHGGPNYHEARAASTESAHLKQESKDKLVEHRFYINKHGEDMPEIRNWKWGVPLPA